MRTMGTRRRSMCDYGRMQLTAKWRDELVKRYSEPHRRYHTLTHVEELLALLREFDLDDRDSVEAAVWFHDVIYDTRATDNEARSAELAATALREMNFRNTDAVRAMILATATHDAGSHEAGSEDPASITRDGLLFLDADLSILGAPPQRYRAYADAIRSEYGWVPPAQFAAGRSAILRRLLDRPSIFQTDEMRARFETQARANVSDEMTLLAKGDPYSRTR